MQYPIQQRIAALRKKGVTNQLVEDALGLSPGYLSKVGRSKRPSRLLIAALELLARDLEAGLAHLQRLRAPPPRPGVLDVGEVLTAARVGWCIGGSRALVAHGIEVRLGEEELDALYVAGRSEEVLPSVRAAGFIVSRFAEATFLVAAASGSVSPTLLIFPAFAPATSACHDPDHLRYLGKRVPVFPLEWLTVCLLMRRDAVSLVHAGRVLSTRVELLADVVRVFDDLEAAELSPGRWLRTHFYDVERGRARLREAAP